VLERLIEQVEMCQGRKLVKVKVLEQPRDGSNPRVVEHEVTALDASDANRALELVLRPLIGRQEDPDLVMRRWAHARRLA
jgi:hypothetical protein